MCAHPAERAGARGGHGHREGAAVVAVQAAAQPAAGERRAGGALDGAGLQVKRVAPLVHI